MDLKMGNILEIFIGALIAVVVGLAFLPTIFSSTTAVTTNANYTGNKNLASTISLVYLVPLIFVILIIVGAVSFLMFRKD